jgi:Putative peptidoglycan binding domain
MWESVRTVSRIRSGILMVCALVGAVALTLIALPLAMYRSATSPAAGGPSSVAAVYRMSDLTSSVQLGLVWSPGRTISATGLSGHVVTAVFVKAGQPVACGGRIVEIDGVPVIAYCGMRPLWRPITGGVKGSDTDQLVNELRRRGILSTTTPSARRLTTAIRVWQRSLKLPVTGVVDPARYVWTGSAVTPTTVAVVPGSSVGGEMGLFAVAPKLLSARLAPPMAVLSTRVFNVDTVPDTFAMAADGSVKDPASLGTLVLARARVSDPLPTSLPGQLRLASPVRVIAIPPAALASGSTGSCVVVGTGTVRHRIPVTVVSSDVDAVLVTGDLPEGTEVAMDGASQGC